MTFRKAVLAYLTGWLIVQPINNRVVGFWRKRELRDPGPDTLAWFTRQAEAVVDVMEARDLVPAPSFPCEENGVLMLGPGVCAAPDRSIVNWEGENYYRQSFGAR